MAQSSKELHEGIPVRNSVKDGHKIVEQRYHRGGVDQEKEEGVDHAKSQAIVDSSNTRQVVTVTAVGVET